MFEHDNELFHRCSDNPLPIDACEDDLKAGGAMISVQKIKKVSTNLPDQQMRYSIGLTFANATSGD